MTPEEELEMQSLRLQKRNAELTAEITTLRKRVGDLERMNRANQNYIGKLQAQAKRKNKTLAEQVFKNG